MPIDYKPLSQAFVSFRYKASDLTIS